MTLSGPTNATLKSDAKTATGTINDDDALPVLSIADATAVAEGEAAQFVVTLAPASSKQVTVSYSTADGTAKASEDYTAASSTTLTFARTRRRRRSRWRRPRTPGTRPPKRSR